MCRLEGSALEEKDVLVSDRETFLSNASFNVVFANETTDGWIGDSDVKIHIEFLNNDYNATSFQFRLVKTTRMKNEDWFGNMYPRSPQEQSMKLLYTVGDASTAYGNFNLQSNHRLSSAFDYGFFIRLRPDTTVELELMSRTRYRRRLAQTDNLEEGTAVLEMDI
ncbi:hypothetical protein D9613_006355 [Agrocybe pediades]|uniref:Uncharacterized protein n=1 Tax=Agrocybe pediades TaxID=84607 RepID=A0A8H4QUJ2_9AGAR|nr:hypothetical protein D9613_006355 [Agrocybe pediades]